jgi:hypothetical protein
MEKTIALKEKMKKEANNFGLLMAGLVMKAQRQVTVKLTDIEENDKEKKQ